MYEVMTGSAVSPPSACHVSQSGSPAVVMLRAARTAARARRKFGVAEVSIWPGENPRRSINTANATTSPHGSRGGAGAFLVWRGRARRCPASACPSIGRVAHKTASANGRAARRMRIESARCVPRRVFLQTRQAGFAPACRMSMALVVGLSGVGGSCLEPKAKCFKPAA